MTQICDVAVRQLRRIPDERGAVFHMLREDDQAFQRFGEIYFSLVYPGAIKAWHIHSRMTLNYAVPMGMIKLVCFDDRSDSPTCGCVQELHVGDLNYCLVTIPPHLWNGFMCEGGEPALVANCATVPHDPGEISEVVPRGVELEVAVLPPSSAAVGSV
jgi:dTDP-4-dehydrorhamnose 3,5-epimerase